MLMLADQHQVAGVNGILTSFKIIVYVLWVEKGLRNSMTFVSWLLDKSFSLLFLSRLRFPHHIFGYPPAQMWLLMKPDSEHSRKHSAHSTAPALSAFSGANLPLLNFVTPSGWLKGELTRSSLGVTMTAISATKWEFMQESGNVTSWPQQLTCLNKSKDSSLLSLCRHSV